MLNSRFINIAFLLLVVGIMVSDNYAEISVWWYAILIAAYSAFQVYGSIVLKAAFFVPVISNGPRNSNNVSLTFDDGPVPGKTEKILEVLDRYHITATFFCIGHRVNEHPALLSRIHHSGHLIGNHSYWHGKLFDLQTSSAITNELEQTNQVIHRIIGIIPRFFRPPYGVTNPMVADAVKSTQCKVIGWSVRSFDTVTTDPSVLFHRVTYGLKAGDVILFHDFCDSTIEMLPKLIEYIKQRGLQIVRLDHLLNEKPYA